MFTALGAYIKNIALIMVISIFTELLLPDAKIKKYVSVIAGIIMMFTIIGSMGKVLMSLNNIDEDINVFNNENIQETENIFEKIESDLYQYKDNVTNN